MCSGILCVSIYNSLMTNDVEHLLICAIAMCLPSWEGHEFRFLVHFLIVLFAFLLLGFKNSSCILGTSPLSDSVLQVYSPGLWFVFHSLSSVSTEQKVLFLMKSKLHFSFMDHDFGVVSKN